MRKLPKLPKAGKPRTLATKHRLPLKKNTRPASGRVNISDHTYDPKTGHLIVTFGGGRQYRYEGVSEAEAKAFADAPSMGQFLTKWSNGIKIGD